MTCDSVVTDTGHRMIVCSSRKVQRCQCGARANLLCDWKMPSRKSGTCDTPLCQRCSTSPAPEKDLCASHAALFEDWKLERRA